MSRPIPPLSAAASACPPTLPPPTTASEDAFVAVAPFDEADRAAVYRAIATRRDVRSEFLPDPIEPVVLARLLAAAHAAPSVGFMQPWTFLVIRDPTRRAALHDAFRLAHAREAAQFTGERGERYRALKLDGLREAPVHVVVTADRHRCGPVVLGRTQDPTTDLLSCACAIQNLWLAARAEGIGLGWVSIVDRPALRAALDIPETIEVVALLALGRVDRLRTSPELEQRGWRTRLALADVVFEDAWGNTGAGPEAIVARL